MPSKLPVSYFFLTPFEVELDRFSTVILIFLDRLLTEATACLHHINNVIHEMIPSKKNGARPRRHCACMEEFGRHLRSLRSPSHRNVVFIFFSKCRDAISRIKLTLVLPLLICSGGCLLVHGFPPLFCINGNKSTCFIQLRSVPPTQEWKFQFILRIAFCI
jgi:hypothetical protein